MTTRLLSNKRKLIEFESHNGVGDSAKFVVQDGGNLYVDLDQPWAGDTESGFGRTCQVLLDKKDAIALRDFLNKAYPVRKKQEAK